jgi:hypothetical protein
MTITTLITVNAALGAVTLYALHHLLAHGIYSDRLHDRHLARHQVVEVVGRESEPIAA